MKLSETKAKWKLSELKAMNNEHENMHSDFLRWMLKRFTVICAWKQKKLSVYMFRCHKCKFQIKHFNYAKHVPFVCKWSHGSHLNNTSPLH